MGPDFDGDLCEAAAWGRLCLVPPPLTAKTYSGISWHYAADKELRLAIELARADQLGEQSAPRKPIRRASWTPQNEQQSHKPPQVQQPRSPLREQRTLMPLPEQPPRSPPSERRLQGATVCATLRAAIHGRNCASSHHDVSSSP